MEAKKYDKLTEENKERKGAGTFIFFKDKQGKIFTYLLQSKKKGIWSDAGGGFDKNDMDLFSCAQREQREESSNLFKFDVNKLQNKGQHYTIENYLLCFLFFNIWDDVTFEQLKEVFWQNHQSIQKYQENNNEVPSCWQGKQDIQFIEYQKLVDKDFQFLLRKRTQDVVQFAEKNIKFENVDWHQLKKYQENRKEEIYNEKYLFIKDLDYFDFE